MSDRRGSSGLRSGTLTRLASLVFIAALVAPALGGNCLRKANSHKSEDDDARSVRSGSEDDDRYSVRSGSEDDDARSVRSGSEDDDLYSVRSGSEDDDRYSIRSGYEDDDDALSIRSGSFSGRTAPSFEGATPDTCYDDASATGKSHIDSADIHRVVVIGDTHGDANAILNSLFAADLIDWSREDDYQVREAAKNTLVVQTGDIVDRGPEDLESIQLLDYLEYKGLRIARLSGNHELLWMRGDYRYAALPEIDSKKVEMTSCQGSLFRRFYNQVNVLLLTHPAHEQRLVFAHGGLAQGLAELAVELTKHLMEDKAEDDHSDDGGYDSEDYRSERSEHSEDYRSERSEHSEDYRSERTEHSEDYRSERSEHSEDYRSGRSKRSHDYRSEYPERLTHPTVESDYWRSTFGSDHYWRGSEASDERSMLLQTGERANMKAKTNLRSRNEYDEILPEPVPEPSFQLTSEIDHSHDLSPKERLGKAINVINEMMRYDFELLCTAMGLEGTHDVLKNFSPRSLERPGTTTTKSVGVKYKRKSPWHIDVINKLKEEDGRFKGLFTGCKDYDDDACVSPVWYRGYTKRSKRSEKDRCKAFEGMVNILARGVDPEVRARDGKSNLRMIMGHTKSDVGITMDCDGRVFDVDVGMSKAWAEDDRYTYGGAALVIDGWNTESPSYSWVGVNRESESKDQCYVAVEDGVAGGEMRWKQVMEGASLVGDRRTDITENEADLCNRTQAGHRVRQLEFKERNLGKHMPVCEMDLE